MGLFNKILGGKNSEDSPLDSREAMAGILLVAIGSDGHFSDDEIESFKVVVNRMELFRDQTAPSFNAMIDKLFGILSRTSPGELLDRCAPALSEELRETAFALATDLVFADGRVEGPEQEMLEDLREKLSVPEELSLKIVEVIMIKNRG